MVEDALDGAILLLLEDLVAVRRLIERQLVGGEVFHAQGIAVEVTRTIASVGCSIFGSGTLSTRTSSLPCQVTAFIDTYPIQSRDLANCHLIRTIRNCPNPRPPSVARPIQEPSEPTLSSSTSIENGGL
jgi:hypothetical protein